MVRPAKTGRKPITRDQIKGLRGKYKHLPLMETLKEMKREGNGFKSLRGSLKGKGVLKAMMQDRKRERGI